MFFLAKYLSLFGTFPSQNICRDPFFALGRYRYDLQTASWDKQALIFEQASLKIGIERPQMACRRHLLIQRQSKNHYIILYP